MSDTKRYIDDAGLAHIAKSMDAQFATNAELTSHTGNTDNPHNVTASQVGAYNKANADRRYETQTDSESNATLFGFLTRPGGVHTLQFYRPGAALNPDPIYELPETTFTGENADIIVTKYILLGQEGYIQDGQLDKWTVFTSVNNAAYASSSGRLMGCTGFTALKSNNPDYAIVAGHASSSTVIRAAGYHWSTDTSEGWTAIIDGDIGKAAFRRDISKSSYIQYTLDGITWIDTTMLIYNLTFQTSENVAWKYLALGGSGIKNFAGKGTISCKLWGQSLDNISELF